MYTYVKLVPNADTCTYTRIKEYLHKKTRTHTDAQRPCKYIFRSGSFHFGERLLKGILLQ